MSILEILRAPWAIAPDKLAEIQAIQQEPPLAKEKT